MQEDIERLKKFVDERYEAFQRDHQSLQNDQNAKNAKNVPHTQPPTPSETEIHPRRIPSHLIEWQERDRIEHPHHYLDTNVPSKGSESRSNGQESIQRGTGPEKDYEALETILVRVRSYCEREMDDFTTHDSWLYSEGRKDVASEVLDILGV